MPFAHTAFEPLWLENGEPVAGHLPLLGPHGCERSVAILRAASAADGTADVILTMLADRDWRPNLVAATTVLFYPRDGRFAGPLWRSFDSGSWVSPQLAVVLSMHDPDFVARAIERVQRGCPMTGDRWGDAVVGRPAPKGLVALLAMLDEPAPEEARRLRAAPEVIAARAEPHDDGERIATRWRAGIRRYIAP